MHIDDVLETLEERFPTVIFETGEEIKFRKEYQVIYAKISRTSSPISVRIDSIQNQRDLDSFINRIEVAIKL